MGKNVMRFCFSLVLGFLMAVTSVQAQTRSEKIIFSIPSRSIAAIDLYVLKTLLEDNLAQTRPGYTLEYCGMTAVDLHGVCLQAAYDAAGRQANGK